MLYGKWLVGVFVQHICLKRWWTEQVELYVLYVFLFSSQTSLIALLCNLRLFFSMMFLLKCVLEDYPLTAGMGSLCTLNYVIFSDVMFWKASVWPLVWVCILCIVASRRLRMSLPLPPPFEGGSNKKAQCVQQAVLPSYTLRLSTWRWIGGPSITKGEKRRFYWGLRMWGDAP